MIFVAHVAAHVEGVSARRAGLWDRYCGCCSRGRGIFLRRRVAQETARPERPNVRPRLVSLPPLPCRSPRHTHVPFCDTFDAREQRRSKAFTSYVFASHPLLKRCSSQESLVLPCWGAQTKRKFRLCLTLGPLKESGLYRFLVCHKETNQPRDGPGCLDRSLKI